ncbi:hypothetical protein BGZ93_002685 [Podila epicladia]|nr:hypothetical protein BGZ92_005252 [Podila epicladia]KAG0097451.1 hypothetical protein BGZ93_002685 [Podila epicladia]
MSRSTLFVSGFSSRTRARDLAYEFERYGPLIRCDIPALRSDSSKPYAFVEFEDDRDAKDAYHAMRDVRFEGYRLDVQFAKNSPSSSWRHEGSKYGRNRSPRRDGRGRGRSPPPRRRSRSPRRRTTPSPRARSPDARRRSVSPRRRSASPVARRRRSSASRSPVRGRSTEPRADQEGDIKMTDRDRDRDSVDDRQDRDQDDRRSRSVSRPRSPSPRPGRSVTP